jgi:large subunit ribosomal protein L25
MSNVDKLNVVVREQRGSNRTKMLRAAGLVPAVVYGHGEETVSVSVKRNEIEAVIRHGGRLVDLTGGVSDSALVTEVQWDSFGNRVMHLDLTRVDKSEAVELTVSVELRGTAPGTKVGGVVTQPIHEIEIKCPVTSIPEKFELNINSLQLDETITAGQIELPKGATLITDPATVLAQCTTPVELDEDEAETDLSEPEVIGRDESDEEIQV